MKEQTPIQLNIQEIVVVEGKDDTAAIKKIHGIDTIETHGFGIKEETWEHLEKAYKERGLIILTDPDYSGEEIRRKLKKRFPESKEAFLVKEKATKGENIGIENAKPEHIAEALQKAKASIANTASQENPIEMEELYVAGLVGQADSAEKRRDLGDRLGIGYGSGRGLLKKLNMFRITVKELQEAVEAISKEK